jgi:hypothetical protein
MISGIHNNSAFLSEFALDGQMLSDRLDQPQGMSMREFCAIGALRDPATDCAQRISEWYLDSPALIWDGQTLVNPPPESLPVDQPPAAGPWLREVEPDVYRVLVHPLPPDIANLIQFPIAPGQPTPPAPQYCQVPVELQGSAPAAREQLFIAPPPVPEDAALAEQYARGQGIAFLPTIACTPDLLSASGNPAVVTAFISQPTPGQVVTDFIPIIGTAQFTPAQAQYYKIEISGGQFGENWVTMGDVHYNSVVNNQLEILQGPNLQPGTYTIQLVVIGNDGNWVQQPYQVSFIKP